MTYKNIIEIFGENGLVTDKLELKFYNSLFSDKVTFIVATLTNPRKVGKVHTFTLGFDELNHLSRKSFLELVKSHV